MANRYSVIVQAGTQLPEHLGVLSPNVRFSAHAGW